MIDIKNFDPNEIKTEKKPYKNIDIFITLDILLSKTLDIQKLVV